MAFGDLGVEPTVDAAHELALKLRDSLHRLRIALGDLGHPDLAQSASDIIFELEDLAESIKHIRAN
jgi:hypothetical protein